jgi:peptide/nickel transport system substrate-binding protein
MNGIIITKLHENSPHHQKGIAFYMSTKKRYLRSLLSSLAVVFAVPASAANKTLKQPRRITVGWPIRPESWDPRSADSISGHELTPLIHCSLISSDKNGATVGDLAESWNWDNPSTVTFLLKDGAKFSDGSPVSAADVKSTFESILNTKALLPAAFARYVSRIKAIRISDRSVTFDLLGPDSAILSELNLGILPSSTLGNAGQNPDEFSRGCGPYKIDSETQNSLTLIKNPFYKLRNAPVSPEITFKFNSNLRTGLSELATGAIDILFGTSKLDEIIKYVQSNPGIRLMKQPEFSTSYLGFNVSDPHLSDIRVRKAIAIAIDRQAIIKNRLSGFAILARTLLLPSHPYFNSKLADIQIDRDGANHLLDEAGYKKRDGKGFRFGIKLKVGLDPQSIEIAKALAADLEKVGISVHVEAMELSKLRIDAIAGDLQLWLTKQVGIGDPDVFRTQFSPNGDSDSIGHWGRYSSAEVDRLVKLALSEFIPGKRKQVYDRVQDLVNGDLPAVFLWHDERVVLLQKNVSGLELHANGSLVSLAGVSIDR